MNPFKALEQGEKYSKKELNESITSFSEIFVGLSQAKITRDKSKSSFFIFIKLIV